MGKVSIVKTNLGIKPALIKSIELIGGLEKYLKHTDKIMLKPNINGTEGITSLDLTESIIQLLNDFGVKEILIAEAAFGPPHLTDTFFHKTGYTGLAKKYGLKLLNLNKSAVKQVAVKTPLSLETINLAQEVFAVDTIINIPVMKVHYATGITLSLKNLKGLLVGDEKRHFHEIGLDKAIVDLNNTIPPTLNIIDCISGMEKMGPRGGDMVQLDFIMAGGDRAEIDYLGTRIMGYTLDEVKHLKYFLDSHPINLDAIEIVGETIDQVKYPFKKAKLEAIIPKRFRHHEKDACSTCMNALLLSYQFLEKEADHDIDIYLGSILVDPELGKGIKIGFGNCCYKNLRDKMPFDKFIRGCPPYPFDLKKALE
ncbi:MAG: DUF362 domain-containing protein [bacterium]